MKYFPKVSRGKVYLSPINVDDYEILAKWLNDSKITDGVNTTKSIISINSEKESLQNSSRDEDFGKKLLAIIRKEDDELLGIVKLLRINYIDQIANIGISIGNYEEHNKGYGADAINAILLYGFHTLNLRNIGLNVYDFNIGAIKCYQKCGFKEYGRRKECHYYNGKFCDEIYMDITKSEREEKNKESLNIIS